MNHPTLPKWPQMIVTGKAVTVEQAEEIIFRTDCFLTSPSPYVGGNNKRFNKRYQQMAGLDRLYESPTHFQLRFDEKVGIVETIYVKNNWASSCYAYGPHGWCNPDGTIRYIDNIGKWPTVEEVVQDWQTLLEAFPYLDLNVTLMSGEWCEDGIEPLVNILVGGGKVEVLPPDLSVHGAVKVVLEDRPFSRNEQGLPDEWVNRAALRVRKVVDEVLGE